MHDHARASRYPVPRQWLRCTTRIREHKDRREIAADEVRGMLRRSARLSSGYGKSGGRAGTRTPDLADANRALYPILCAFRANRSLNALRNGGQQRRSPLATGHAASRNRGPEAWRTVGRKCGQRIATIAGPLLRAKTKRSVLPKQANSFHFRVFLQR